MAAQKQDDQLERTFSSYVRIQDVVLKTYLGRWTIRRSGERGSGISVLPARYDDDDDDDDDYQIVDTFKPFAHANVQMYTDRKYVSNTERYKHIKYVQRC